MRGRQLPNRLLWREGIGAHIHVEGRLSVDVDITAKGDLDSIAHDKIADALEAEAREYRRIANEWRAIERNRTLPVEPVKEVGP